MGLEFSEDIEREEQESERREKERGVPIHLDPRWRWLGVDYDGEAQLFVDRPAFYGDAWLRATDDDDYCQGVGFDCFEHLKPSTLYEIIDGRFVERESHV